MNIDNFNFNLNDLLKTKTNLVHALSQPINAWDNDFYEDFQMGCMTCTAGCTSCYGSCQGATKR
jgi:hypothetical protein